MIVVYSWINSLTWKSPTNDSINEILCGTDGGTWGRYSLLDTMSNVEQDRSQHLVSGYWLQSAGSITITSACLWGIYTLSPYVQRWSSNCQGPTGQWSLKFKMSLSWSTSALIWWTRDRTLSVDESQWEVDLEHLTDTKHASFHCDITWHCHSSQKNLITFQNEHIFLARCVKISPFTPSW